MKKKSILITNDLEKLNYQKNIKKIRDFQPKTNFLGRLYKIIFRTIRKFTNLSAYDYFNEREEIYKKEKNKKNKYFWKTALQKNPK